MPMYKLPRGRRGPQMPQIREGEPLPQPNKDASFFLKQLMPHPFSPLRSRMPVWDPQTKTYKLQDFPMLMPPRKWEI